MSSPKAKGRRNMRRLIIKSFVGLPSDHGWFCDHIINLQLGMARATKIPMKYLYPNTQPSYIEALAKEIKSLPILGKSINVPGPKP